MPSPPANQRAADCHRLIARVKRHRQTTAKGYVLLLAVTLEVD